jgi:uncharacterized membrane protein YoaK (UPF0700 family)
MAERSWISLGKQSGKRLRLKTVAEGELMPESAESRGVPPSSYSSLDRTHEELLRRRFPAQLSLIAGMVDVIGYLGLKLFTAHVTGNIVIIAAQLVYGGPPKMDQILAVPVFIVAVAGVWITVQVLNRRGPALPRLLLLIQFLLLSCVLIVAVVYHPDADPSGLTADVTAMIAVSAMASQYSLLQLTMPGAPSTAVMTGNLTKTVLAFLETASDRQPLMADARQHLKKAIQVVIGFFIGCLIGAGAFFWLQDWAWSLPVIMAGVGLALAPREHSAISSQQSAKIPT